MVIEVVLGNNKWVFHDAEERYGIQKTKTDRFNQVDLLTLAKDHDDSSRSEITKRYGTVISGG
jgi:hypothetical protein